VFNKCLIDQKKDTIKCLFSGATSFVKGLVAIASY